MASTSNVVKRFGIVDLTEAVEDAIDYQHFLFLGSAETRIIRNALAIARHYLKAAWSRLGVLVCGRTLLA
jgi:precorrin-3B methylase